MKKIIVTFRKRKQITYEIDAFNIDTISNMLVLYKDEKIKRIFLDSIKEYKVIGLDLTHYLKKN